MTDLDMRAGIITHCRNKQLEHALAWTEAEEASLRAAYGRTRMAETRPFEEAMAIPAIARAVRCMAHAMSQTPGELFQEEHRT
jgi:hypothetical protein